MPQAYLHDIPFDTFIKYYLNNENDADAISTNARYQPVYKVYTVDNYYQFVYTAMDDNGNAKQYGIKTINPMPIDIGGIGNKIYPTKDSLTLSTPRLAPTGLNLFKRLDRSKKIIPVYNDSDDVFNTLVNLDENTPIFSSNSSEYCKTAENTTVYYIPIQDAVSNFFDNLSLYEYYGKIKDNIYYSVIKKEVDGAQRMCVRLLEPTDEDHDTIDINFKPIESIESNIKIVMDTLYQDPDYDNIYYYSVINTKTKREVGKIYQLEPHNVLDYNDNGKAHFVDTYKAPGMLNYDLWFDEKNMPISPIMKYHLYMREYKSSLASTDLDPTSDATKYEQTNTLYYKDFADHGEIGYAYKVTERVTTPIVLEKIIKQDPICQTIMVPITVIKPVKPIIKDIKPITSKFSETSISQVSAVKNLADKMIFTAAVTTTIKSPVATAKSTTITANGAKKLTLATPTLRPKRGAKKVAVSAAIKPFSNTLKVDLANVKNSTSTQLANALKNNINDLTFKSVDKVAATSIKDIKNTAKQIITMFTTKTIYIEQPDIVVKLKETVKKLAKGSVTFSFFNTKDIYKINILSEATIELNKGLSVSAEAKAITERDHSLQKIIIDAISNNTEQINGTVAKYADLPATASDGAIYKITEQSRDTASESNTIYAANTLFKYNATTSSWVKYTSYTFALPSSGEKTISNLQNNVVVSIASILDQTKFFLYRNNIFVLTLNKSNKSVKVQSIYKYLMDCIANKNVLGENHNGIVETETVNPNNDTRTKVSIDFRISNGINGSALYKALDAHKSKLNDFNGNDALLSIKTVFSSASVYSKASIHSQDRVSENILLDKYKTAFYNVAVNTMTNKESNIYSSSAITDKFDMYVYVTSLYDNLIKSLSVDPVKNKGGICYDHKNETTYFGFMDYDCDSVSFNYIKSDTTDVTEPLYLNKNDTLTQEEQTSLMYDIESTNYIKRLLNYKQYNLNAEEFNHRYDDELYRRNYKKITESEDLHETFKSDLMTTKTYEEHQFAISDLLDKSLTLYTEYLYANNNKDTKDVEDIDSPTSFNRRTLGLYTSKIKNNRNIFKLNNNDTYQLKHVFKNDDDDEALFIESLTQKINRGE